MVVSASIMGLLVAHAVGIRIGLTVGGSDGRALSVDEETGSVDASATRM